MTDNRESYLTAAVAELSKLVADAGETVPTVRVSVGFPINARGKSAARAIGECHSGKASADGIAQIFISPELADSSRVLDVLLHELVHATVGTAAGHRKPFSQLAKATGLAKPWTATHATPELKEKLAEIIALIGEYPHVALSTRGRKVARTYLIKAACENGDCDSQLDGGYVIRITQKWLDYGLAACGVCAGPLYPER